MQYGQIVFILFILLLLYYAGMIVMDLRQAKAAKAAELDNRSEEDIDISDEAKNFKPVQVLREELQRKLEFRPAQDTVPDELPGDEDDETRPDANEYKPETGGADSPEESEEKEEENEVEAESGEEAPTAGEEQPIRSPGYREAIMTGGIKVEKLLEIVNHITDDSNSEVGAIIYSCQELRQNPK